MVFASEPDITLLANDGQILGGIEIKAGLDPAGALERLGAMLKSFDEILGRNPSATTILVASCITDEVQRRLNDLQSVRLKYILTEVISDEDAGQKFANRVRSVLGLIAKRL